MLIHKAWDHVRLRPTAKWSEYEKWYQKWLMLAFGVIRVESPKSFDQKKRAEIAIESWNSMLKVVSKCRGLLIFPQGFILPPGSPVDPKNRGAYDLCREFKDKPVILVSISGLEKSRLGGSSQEKCELLRRMSVEIKATIWKDLDRNADLQTFNKLLSQHWKRIEE